MRVKHKPGIMTFYGALSANEISTKDQIFIPISLCKSLTSDNIILNDNTCLAPLRTLYVILRFVTAQEEFWSFITNCRPQGINQHIEKKKRETEGRVKRAKIINSSTQSHQLFQLLKAPDDAKKFGKFWAICWDISVFALRIICKYFSFSLLCSKSLLDTNS